MGPQRSAIGQQCVGAQKPPLVTSGDLGTGKRVWACCVDHLQIEVCGMHALEVEKMRVSAPGKR